MNCSNAGLKAPIFDKPQRRQGKQDNRAQEKRQKIFFADGS